MAKISTYPSADTPLLLSDRLIGTEAIREIPSPIPLATKNFSLGELLTLFSSNFPAASLQEVLDMGNTAIQDIYLTGRVESTVIKPVNIEDPTGSQGTTFQYLSKGNSSINWVDLPIDGLQDVLNKQNTATQNITLTGNITSTYITPGNIKDESLNTGSIGQVLTKSATGLMWKNSSVPTAAPLADVLFTGNTATNDIILTGNFIKTGGTSSQFLKADGSVDSSTYALASSLPTLTSDLTNDGDDGINPFISLADVPAQVNSDWNATSGVAEILNKPTIPDVSGYVPYTGATQDVDLGEYELKAGQIEFDTTPTGTAGVAVMRWNDSDGTLDLGLKGGNVTLQVGQESVLRVVNKTATNVNLLEANYQAVRVTGAQGQRLKVDLALATTDPLSAETLGLVTETINNNQEGFITTSGLVRGINTTGSLQGETWADGDILYLSPTTAGNATKVKPTAPNHLIVLGYVVRAHVNQGSIFVKVDNGYELDELHNVYIDTPLNNQVLQYESATSLWKNKTLATGLTVGTTPITSGAVGRILFEGTGNVLQESANLFWNASNNRLGINTTTPNNALHVIGGGIFSSSITISGGFVMTEGGNVHTFTAPATNRTIRFITNSQSFSLAPTGNVLINTTTDAGFKLDVNGTARVQGNAQFGTGFYWDNTNSRLGIGTASPTHRVNVLGATGAGRDVIKFKSEFSYTGYLATTNSFVGLSTQANSGGSSILLSDANVNVVGASGIQFTTGGSERARFAITTGNFLIGTGTDAGYKLDVNGTARVSSSFRCDGQVTFTSAIIATAQVRIGSNPVAASSVLDVQSTTKGFLPPRMTTTQRDAIASPAAGLQVFDITLNQMSYYNGTSWVNI